MSSQKRLSWELVIFGITFVAAGFFVYLQQKNISIVDIFDQVVQQIKPVNTQRAEVLKEKSITEQNYKNFVRSKSLDELVSSDQYKELQGLDVIIDTEVGVGNNQPFNKPQIELQQ
jgi:aspartate/glutamate racemase